METLKKQKVLIVDDEPDLREIIGYDLNKAGYDVAYAESGNAALKLLQTEAFDAVVSDIRMPEGDGIFLLTEIRKRNSKKPNVILITGFTDLPPEEAYNLGAAAVFPKPFSRKSLLHSLEQALAPADQRWLNQPSSETTFEYLALFPSYETAKLENKISIGQGGIFVTINENFPMQGEKIRFQIDFEDHPGTPLVGTGIVSWVRPRAAAPLLPGVGIEIHTLTTSSYRYILQLTSGNDSCAFIPKGG